MVDRLGSDAAVRVRSLAAVRAAWGGVLVLSPQRVLRLDGYSHTGWLPRAVLRVLGVRHLAQAAATAYDERLSGPGAGVDALHALTDVGLAARSSQWRRAATVDAAVTTSFSAAAWVTRPRGSRAEGTSGMGGRRIAVVTGGSAGVGRAVVRELAEHGWDVGVLARGSAGLDGAVKDAEKAGARAIGVETDVADLAQVEAAAERIERELGPIDAWINVAFSGSLRFFWDTSDDAFRRMTEVTYFGQVNGVRVALSYMRPRNRGTIVNVGSALAFRGIPLQSAYCGAKHAIVGFTESVITELKHEGSKVRLCQVQLPAVNTTQFDWNDNEFDEHPMPVAPIFQPEVPARAIRYVAEHPRRNMWVGISTAYTILGNRVAPGFLDWYLGKTGVKSQLSKKDGPRFGSNVYQPGDQEHDRGAHGMFDDKAHASDPWSAASMRRIPVAAGAVGVAAAAGAVAVARKAIR